MSCMYMVIEYGFIWHTYMCIYREDTGDDLYDS